MVKKFNIDLSFNIHVKKNKIKNKVQGQLAIYATHQSLSTCNMDQNQETGSSFFLFND